MQSGQKPTRRAPRTAAAVSGIVERRHTLPILANILITQGRRRACRFLATDIEMQITTHAEVGRRRDAAAHGGCPQAARHPARAARSRRRHAVAAGQAHDGARRARAASRCRRLPPKNFRRLAQAEQATPRVTLPQKALEAPASTGAVRDGAAGHPLLPERPAAGGRRQEREARRDRRPPAGACQSKLDGRIAAPGSHHAAQDHARTRKLLADSDEPVSSRSPPTRSSSASATSSWCPSWSTASSRTTRA